MKKIICLILGIFCISCGFTKDNPNAQNYKTHETSDKNAPVVYFIREINAENLVKVYDALNWTAKGKVGVKMSTGEPPASNYLRPELIKNLVQKVDGAIVECNTAYGGSRASNRMHKQVAKDHGLDNLTSHGFDLLDEDDYMTIPVNGGIRLKEDYVGSHFANYDSYVILTHFKGHAMAGFGGAMKNLSIGFGSGTSVSHSGKCLIHTGGNSYNSWRGGTQDSFIEAMAEASKGVVDYMNKKNGMAYVSVMNRLSVDCDCDGNPAEPDMHDIGILASLDPVAIDQAAIDLVWTAKDSGSLIDRINRQNGRYILEHAEKIGLGSREYRLVELK